MVVLGEAKVGSVGLSALTRQRARPHYTSKVPDSTTSPHRSKFVLNDPGQSRYQHDKARLDI